MATTTEPVAIDDVPDAITNVLKALTTACVELTRVAAVRDYRELDADDTLRLAFGAVASDVEHAASEVDQMLSALQTAHDRATAVLASMEWARHRDAHEATGCHCKGLDTADERAVTDAAHTATVTVTVRDSAAERWGSGPGGPVTRTVTISAFCPTCGGRRGEPHRKRYVDDGDWYTVENWDNPCGHIDYYHEVLAEARSLAAKANA